MLQRSARSRWRRSCAALGPVARTRQSNLPCRPREVWQGPARRGAPPAPFGPRSPTALLHHRPRAAGGTSLRRPPRTTLPGLLAGTPGSARRSNPPARARGGSSQRRSSTDRFAAGPAPLGEL